MEAVLVSREQDREVFRELFEAFFRNPNLAHKLLSQLLPSAEGVSTRIAGKDLPLEETIANMSGILAKLASAAKVAEARKAGKGGAAAAAEPGAAAPVAAVAAAAATSAAAAQTAAPASA